MKDIQPHEGQLSKYTNVVKGWQYRWFVINPDSGTLEYYVSEDFKTKRRPRAQIHLAGAVISPSDEDSQTFTVNSASGDVYKLRATDAKERQHWVNRLRSVAEYHTQVIAQKNPPLPPREQRSTTPSPAPSHQEFHTSLIRAQQRVMYSNASVYDAFSSVSESLIQANTHQLALANNIESLPSSGANITCVDPDLLLLKAASQATLLCMEHCLSILQQQHQANTYHQTGVPGGASTELIDSRAQFVKLNNPTPILNVSTPSQSKLTSTQTESNLTVSDPVENLDDEIPDLEDSTDADLGTVEEHKSVILHLLSQLKLGMDLTRVVLPTFILERRSLLEMFADFMGHPDLFISIADAETPELRMLAMVEWYLTSFHVGRKGATLAKKPYNPIIGEVFNCSWKVSNPSAEENENPTKISYVAEQVSHHPPVSAFYVECPEKNMCLNAHVWTKSKFMGMSIGVNMIGEAVLYLTKLDEEYTFQLPSAFARSILTVPWVELGGKVTITCAKTGYVASITFHTKPFYGGKLHRVTTEVRNPQNVIICRVQGEWNGILEFIYEDGKTKLIDTSEMPIAMKCVKPLEKQSTSESRKLWHQVTLSLQQGDIERATFHKKLLEDCQRSEERQRLELKQSYLSKHFQQSEDAWIYCDMLMKAKSSTSIENVKAHVQ